MERLLDLKFIFGLLLSLSLASLEPTLAQSIDESLLTSTWCMSPDKVVENMNSGERAYYDSLDVSRQAALRNKIRQYKYIFSAGGSLTTQRPADAGTPPSNQTWRIDSATNLLYIDTGTGEGEKSYEVISLTSQEFTLRKEDNTVIYLVP